MGYYTKYELEIIHNQHPTKSSVDIIADLRDQVGGAHYALSCLGCFCQETKWYSCLGDMETFSLLYPGSLFRVKGVGEEEEDVWVCYFKDGKSQMCKAKITFDSYDEEKLT